MATLAERLAAIETRIQDAARQANRLRDEITLVVVSKNHPAQLVVDLVDLGQRHFGENRDQEAAPKAAEVSIERPGLANWHFVGQLQTNKVKSVLNYASTVHSLDRESLLREISKVASNRGIEVEVFIQLNLTDDPERGGIEPANLLAFAEAAAAAPGIKPIGVMAVASLEGQEERDFGLVAAASQKLQTVIPAASLVSAGMSGDFEQAISFGATHLRIGTAITGTRPS